MTATGRLRIAVLVLLVCCGAAAIGLRLYQLQILSCERFRARAEDQHRSRMVVPAMRGAILDRHGEPLAVSTWASSLFAHPWRVETPERAAALLAPLIELSPRALRDRLSSDRPFVYLQRLLDPPAVERVRQLDLPFGDNAAFGFQTEPKRVYPHGRLAGHVVGYATIDGDGVEGVELEFDESLRGDPTVYLVRRDARSGRLREPIGGPRKRPSDVVLTLDAVLQHLVERELDQAMRETGARASSAVVMVPRSGEILALANRPAVDPNHFGRASAARRINRAVVGVYEPGSTFKVITMAAALDRGRVRPDQRIYCENGTYRSGRRTIHDVSAHGMLTPREILEKSSNIGIVKVAERLEPEEFLESITRFGFGSKTGIELPGESAGLLASLSEWSGFSRASLAFGQEIGVTAVQMASAVSTIANDGVLVPPRVVLGRRDVEGRMEPSPAPPARRVIRGATARLVGRMLEGVVRSGTGKRAAVAGYRIAGKSGTAQKARIGAGYSEEDYVASFVGYGPVSGPRVVVLVVIDSPDGRRHQGGQVAAPVFGRIMTEALHYLRVPPDDDRAPRVVQRRSLLTSGSAASRGGEPSTHVEARRGTVPDVVGLDARDAVALLTRRGYRTVLRGAGSVAAQEPAAGTHLAAGEACTLRLEERGSHARTIDERRRPRRHSS